jgi:hypothetical protein
MTIGDTTTRTRDDSLFLMMLSDICSTLNSLSVSFALIS